MLSMLHARQHSFLCSFVTLQFVGDNHGDRHPVLRHTGRRSGPAFRVEAITACNGGTLVEDLEEKWVGVAERLDHSFVWTV
jgi:hypothetical protein